MQEGFEEKIGKAKELLEKLNEADITLEQSMKIYKEGIKILNESNQMLENAKLILNEANSEDVG